MKFPFTERLVGNCYTLKYCKASSKGKTFHKLHDSFVFILLGMSLKCLVSDYFKQMYTKQKMSIIVVFLREGNDVTHTSHTSMEKYNSGLTNTEVQSELL